MIFMVLFYGELLVGIGDHIYNPPKRTVRGEKYEVEVVRALWRKCKVGRVKGVELR